MDSKSSYSSTTTSTISVTSYVVFYRSSLIGTMPASEYFSLYSFSFMDTSLLSSSNTFTESSTVTITSNTLSSTISSSIDSLTDKNEETIILSTQLSTISPSSQNSPMYSVTKLPESTFRISTNSISNIISSNTLATSTLIHDEISSTSSNDIFTKTVSIPTPSITTPPLLFNTKESNKLITAPIGLYIFIVWLFIWFFITGISAYRRFKYLKQYKLTENHIIDP